MLIILTSPQGLMDFEQNEVIPFIPKVEPKHFSLVNDKQDKYSTGGMTSKLTAAQSAQSCGAQVLIASGFESEVMIKACQGEILGTLIGQKPQGLGHTKARKLWISQFHQVQGQIEVDQGAQSALIDYGKSLLPSGIVSVNGEFKSGDLVQLVYEQQVFAQGLVDYSSEEILKIKGHHSQKIKDILGALDYEAVIHRDNMVLN